MGQKNKKSRVQKKTKKFTNRPKMREKSEKSRLKHEGENIISKDE